ncbi:MAG TPA: bifunctional nuclease family protein [bacterium]|jgi:bifunctional DNase/RNase
MIPVEVTGVSVCPPYQGYVVILREKDGERWLPIFIGAAEAQAISLLLQDLHYSRPLTFDLFHNLIKAASAQVQRIAVTELKDNTFYALVDLKTAQGAQQIDARPSDAIALALKSKVPILVAEEVMNSAGITGDRAEAQPSNLDEIALLSRQLQDALDSESYEEAAKLRDRIRELEKKENLR